MSPRDFPQFRRRCVLCHGTVAGMGCVLHWRKNAMDFRGTMAKLQGSVRVAEIRLSLMARWIGRLLSPAARAASPRVYVIGLRSRFMEPYSQSMSASA